ncbi:MAG: alpha/beta fold hydrolase [Chitinophagales bacterium]
MNIQFKWSLFFILLFTNVIFGQQAMDSSEYIRIGGIRQFVKLQGADRSKPILLFLTGGPGESSLGFANLISKKLQKHFLFVQWDQRECGQTLSKNKSPEKLTVDLFKNDTHELIDSLLEQFHQKKLYLLGWSWGTVLGFYVAEKYPEQLYAYLAVCPVINQQKSETIALQKLIETAKQQKNKEALEDLAIVKIPFENQHQLFNDRKWLINFDGKQLKAMHLPKKYLENWASLWMPVFDSTFSNNLLQTLPRLNCPVYIFAGRKDYQTNFGITEEYYNRLIAPKKDLFWFDNAGHRLPITDSEAFQDLIINKVMLP